MTKTEIINKAIEELEKHIEFCEQESSGHLVNNVCHISLKFDKRLLSILKENNLDNYSEIIKTEEEEIMKPINAIKKGKLKLEWYVLNHDFNTKEIYNFNVLQQGYLLDLIRMIEDKYYNVHDLISLKECIDRWANYNFNHKTECEIWIHGWFDKEDKETKISVYDQLKPNLDILTQYINKKLQLFEEK